VSTATLGLISVELFITAKAPTVHRIVILAGRLLVIMTADLLYSRRQARPCAAAATPIGDGSTTTAKNVLNEHRSVTT
jgi:hypothetical protein